MQPLIHDRYIAELPLGMKVVAPIQYGIHRPQKVHGLSHHMSHRMSHAPHVARCITHVTHDTLQNNNMSWRDENHEATSSIHIHDATSTRCDDAPSARSIASTRSSGSRPATMLSVARAAINTTLSPALGSCAAERHASRAPTRSGASVQERRCRQHAASRNGVKCSVEWGGTTRAQSGATPPACTIRLRYRGSRAMSLRMPAALPAEHAGQCRCGTTAYIHSCHTHASPACTNTSITPRSTSASRRGS